jgi:hypothetical protein
MRKLLFLLPALAVLSACDQGKPASTADGPEPVAQTVKPDIRAADSCVKNIEVYGAVTNIDCVYTSAWDDAQYLDKAAFTAEAIGQAMQAGAPEGKEADAVNISYFTMVQDQTGHQSQERYMGLTFAGYDLRTAKYENLSTPSQILNLVREVSRQPVSFAGIDAWCRKNGIEGAAFCAKAQR